MRFLLLANFLVIVTACGDDGTGGSGASSASGGAGAGASGGSGGGGNAPVTCGDALTCAANEACVVTVIEPACMNKQNDADPCPEGTTESICGGAGFPCCEPTPEPDRACLEASACGASVSCTCLPDVCEIGTECQDSGEGEVTCAPLPKP